MLILKACDREEIKRRVTIHDQRFYLEEPYTGAKRGTLYYRPNGSTSHDAAIKIDVLTPGDAELPPFNTYWISIDNDRVLHAAPLLLVLLHKTLGWWRRLNSPDYETYKKHWRDADDVANLLKWSSLMGVTIDGRILPEEFIYKAGTWVSMFMEKYPRDEIRSYWAEIGFHKSAQGGMTIVIGEQGGKKMLYL